MNVHEFYVSFETAKLLKEKGFDSECHSYYYPCHYPDGSIQYHRYIRTELTKNLSYYEIHSLKNLPKDHYLAPTLQMAMKWLREVYDLHIIVSPYKVGNEEKAFHWCCEVYKSFNLLGCRIYVNETPKSYEEGVKIAIKYCLEHLIHITKSK